MRLLIKQILLFSLIAFSGGEELWADEPRVLAIGGGVGGVECPKFNSISKDARRFDAGKGESLTHLSNFMNYITGYSTGYNQVASLKCDIIAGYSTEQLLSWTENWCQNHPLEKFGSAVVALGTELGARNCK